MNSDRRTAVFLITVLAIVWGSSFILIKRGLLAYSPLQVGALRMLAALICLLPFIISRIKNVQRSKIKYFLLSGFLGNGIPSVLFPLAETKISSAMAGMLNAMTPVFTFIVGLSFFGMRAGRNRVNGLLIGLFGAVLLISGQAEGGEFTRANSYAFIVVIAAICYAFSVNILRYKLNETDAITNSAFALLFAGVPMAVYLFTTDFITRTVTSEFAVLSFTCVILLGIFSTAMSTVLFNRLIKISGALAASSVTYLIPLVATIWGFIDHELLNFTHVLGLGAILGGVYLINRSA
jgi:drug/metabolite transporter (DMT)-like permease